MNTFSKKEILSFEKDGFVTKPDFSHSGEGKLIQQETERLFSKEKSRNVAIDEDGKESVSKQNLQLISLFEHSKVFRSLPYQKENHPIHFSIDWRSLYSKVGPDLFETC